MIIGTNIIDVLDTKHQSMKQVTVESIIPTFHIPTDFMMEETNKDGFLQLARTVIPEDMGLKIRDLDGWTVLLSVTKLKIPRNKLFLTLNNDVIVSEYEKLLLYYPGMSIIGFHGEVKYYFETIMASKAGSNIDMRIGRNKFDKVDISISDKEFNIGYIIETKSGFYSLGETKLHMHGSGGPKNWYK